MRFFDREHSQEAPVPLIISATSIAYRSRLHIVNEDIEEVGILLTVSISSLHDASTEEQIRERQRLLCALQRLSEVVHEAANTARVKLEEAPEAQRKLLIPAPP